MNSMTNNNNKNHFPIAKTKAQSAPVLLFFRFICPHCGEHNVFSKAYIKEALLCSNSGCKKIIIIENFKEIA